MLLTVDTNHENSHSHKNYISKPGKVHLSQIQIWPIFACRFFYVVQSGGFRFVGDWLLQIEQGSIVQWIE